MSNVNAVTNNKGTVAEHGTRSRQSYYTPKRHIAARGQGKENGNQVQEIKVMTITPESAQEILDNRGKNRRIKPTVVNRYAHDMAAGNWMLSPSPISFDQDGQLLDGQHRLSAVIKANKPIDFWVATNIPREVPFDIHRSRNTIDNLLCSGLIDDDMGDKQYGSIVNAFLKLRMGGDTFNSLSDYDKQHILNKYSKEIKLSKSISNAGKHCAKLNKAPVQASIMSALILGYDSSDLYDFAETANTLMPCGDNPRPALVLRRMIDDVPMTRRQLSSITEQAIVDTVSGKARKRNYDVNAEPPITINISFEEAMA